MILRDIKIKFEILGQSRKDVHIGCTLGSPLPLMVYSRRDSSLAPFYLFSPVQWKVSALPSEQTRVNIFFTADPEMPLIGKRINFLKNYDAIKFPIGKIAKAMKLDKTTQIHKIIEAVYINGIEIRKVEFTFVDTLGDVEMEITEITVNEWFSRPFRNVEKEYLKAIKESTEIE